MRRKARRHDSTEPKQATTATETTQNQDDTVQASDTRDLLTPTAEKSMPKEKSASTEAIPKAQKPVQLREASDEKVHLAPTAKKSAHEKKSVSTEAIPKH